MHPSASDHTAYVMYSSSDGQGPDIGPGPGGGAFKFVQTKRKRAKHTHALASATFVCYIMQQKFLLPRPNGAVIQRGASQLRT